MRRPYVGIIGAGECNAGIAELAREVGREVARAGAILVCGGLGGVMEAACQGAHEAGGMTVGILPGDRTDEANRYVTLPIATGLGAARNYVIVNTADALIAIDGGHGTLSEIGFALKAGKRVIGLRTFELPGITKAENAGQAVELALAAAGSESDWNHK